MNRPEIEGLPEGLRGWGEGLLDYLDALEARVKVLEDGHPRLVHKPARQVGLTYEDYANGS